MLYCGKAEFNCAVNWQIIYSFQVWIERTLAAGSQGNTIKMLWIPI